MYNSPQLFTRIYADPRPFGARGGWLTGGNRRFYGAADADLRGN